MTRRMPTTPHRMTRFAALAAGLFAFPLAARAQDAGPKEPDNNLSETETSYIGARMLEGEKDVTFEDVGPGSMGEEGWTRYAFFSGNTMYAGVSDDVGNTIDMIVEFFWFESSIPRGSDFYVGVVKARTSPNLLEDYRLAADDGATLMVDARTDATTGLGAFRWDWSIPFDTYGWDSYGNVSMETSYGVGLSGEGSAQKAVSVDPEGVKVEATVQAKGFLNTDYKVQTKYEVTLWRWQVLVNSNAGQLRWQLVLNNGDREEQNAYHEFFIVMQADEGEPFRLESLEVGGTVKRAIPFWFDELRPMSAMVTGLVLHRPELPPEPEPEPEPNPEPEPSPWADAGSFPWPENDLTEETQPEAGCTVATGRAAGSAAGLLALALVAGLALSFRRGKY